MERTWDHHDDVDGCDSSEVRWRASLNQLDHFGLVQEGGRCHHRFFYIFISKEGRGRAGRAGGGQNNHLHNSRDPRAE